MGFAQEIRDFTAAYGAVTDIGEKKKNRELAEKKLNHDIEYDNALLELKKQEFGLKQQKLSAGSGGTGGTGGAGGASSSDTTGVPTTKDGKFKQNIFKEGVSTDDNRTQDYNNEAGDDVAKSDEPKLPDTSGYTDELAEEALDGYATGGLVEKKAGPFQVALPTEPEPTAPAAAPAAEPAAPAAPASGESSPRPKANPRAALPQAADAPAAEPAASAAPAESSAASKASTIVVRKAVEATGAALDGFEKKYSTAPQAVGGEEFDERSDLATGQGGMTFEEYEAIAQTVDPNGEIPKRLQSAANISAAYDFFVNKGEPEKAVEVAKAYLVTELRMNQTLGVLAQTAFEDGNVVEGCKILNDACSRFPSGHQIVVEPSDTGRFMYQVINPEGKVIEKESIGTDELMESVEGIADGSLYKKMLAHTVVASRPKKGEDGGTYTAALDGVKQSQAALVDAVTAYESMPDDASMDERNAAYAKVEQARSALDEAATSAKEIGAKGFTGQGNRVSHEGDVFKQVESTAALPEEFALPEAPTEPEPGFWSTVGGALGFGGDKPASKPASKPAEATAPEATAPEATAPEADNSTLSPAPPDVLQRAKAAIAQGAPPAAVAARLKEQGFSAEGL